MKKVASRKALVDKDISQKSTLRFRLGLLCLILTIILPLFSFIVPFFNLSLTVKTTIISILTLGAPEVMIVLGILLLGKTVVVEYKEKFLNKLAKIFGYKRKTKV